MARHCLNCGHPVKEKYCPQCSQNTNVQRISWKSFTAEFVHTLTHAERSIAGTTWQLILHPDKVLVEYLAGKRKKYQPPVSFFLVWVTLSILTQQIIIAHSGFHPVYYEGLTFSSPESIQAFIAHGQWFYILTFPLSALLFYIILARPVYSYIESIVITMYAFSVTYMFFVLSYLIGGGLLSLNVLHWKFYLFQILMSTVYTLWVCILLFRTKKIKEVLSSRQTLKSDSTASSGELTIPQSSTAVGLKLFWLRLIIYMTLNLIIVLKFLEFLSVSWLKIEQFFQH